MEPKPRREILGSVVSLLAAPLVLGKEAVVATFLRDESQPKPPMEINPPVLSVKRRG